MIQCPECRQMIPDDSAFCDQCGKELKWCPECRRPKRGTECPVCGSDLVPGRKWLASPSTAEAEEKTGTPPTSAIVGNGWKLRLQAGQFGRSGGIWPELAGCPYVSGFHGTIAGGPGAWTISDRGSTNGTFINGRKLGTGEAYELKHGDKVRIATLDFIVE